MSSNNHKTSPSSSSSDEETVVICKRCPNLVLKPHEMDEHRQWHKRQSAKKEAKRAKKAAKAGKAGKTGSSRNDKPRRSMRHSQRTTDLNRSTSRIPSQTTVRNASLFAAPPTLTSSNNNNNKTRSTRTYNREHEESTSATQSIGG